MNINFFYSHNPDHFIDADDEETGVTLVALCDDHKSALDLCGGSFASEATEAPCSVCVDLGVA